jgi:hypothetical protein
MTAAPGDDHPLDGRLAYQARLPFSPINPMLQLKETFLAVRVHVVGN